MNAVELLEESLKSTNIPYAEEKYHGESNKYLTYLEEDSKDADFADNRPQRTETFFQVHYFCPARPQSADDSRNKTLAVKKELRKRGFCFTGVTRLKEENDKRHVIINCNIKTENTED